jgi:hypothetical protein
MWIAGADLPGDGTPEVVRNPATEEPLAEVPAASHTGELGRLMTLEGAGRWSRTASCRWSSRSRSGWWR